MRVRAWWRERRDELLRFGVVGGVAFVVDIGLFNLLQFGPGAPLADKVVTAKIVSAVVATVVSWLGNRLWTFRDRRTGRPGDELLVFAVINGLALLIPVATVAFTAYVLDLGTPLAANVAAIVGIGIGTVTRYVAYRRYVFTDPDALRQRLIRVLAAAPERILLLTVALTLACGVAVSFGALRPWLVLPLAGVLAVVGWRVLPNPRADAASARGGAWLLTGAGAWFLANLPWVAEYIIVRRDPAFLTLGGLWLADHPSADIPAGLAFDASETNDAARIDHPDWWNRDGEMVQTQGAKLLPALLAMGGWIGGERGVLLVPLAIGALGLVAVYVLAREAMGPIASLVPVAALSLTASHVWLSRSAYTEMIVLVLFVAAITWAWRGAKEGRAGPLILAAFASGATTLARIDGAAFALGVLVGISVAVAGLATRSVAWRARTIAMVALIQGGMVAGGYASVWRWSRAYAERLDDEVGLLTRGYILTVGVALALALALGIAALVRGAGGRPRRARPSRALAVAASSAVVLAFVGFASRPLWMVSHSPANPQYVEWLQALEGQTVDGSRDYAESTVTWLSYYLTWPLLALGVAGFAIMAWRWASDERAWAIPLAAFLIPTFAFLLRPSIVPDQPWAIRRLSTQGIVGLIFAAAVAWRTVIPVVRRRWGAVWANDVRRVAAGAIVLAPVIAWFPWVPAAESPAITLTTALYQPEQAGAWKQSSTLCDYVDGRPVVLLGTGSHLGMIRVRCDVPVVYLTAPINASSLVEMTVAFGEPPVVITGHPDRVPWASPPSAPTYTGDAHYIRGSLVGLPTASVVQGFDFYIGEVRADGTVDQVIGEPES